MRQLAIEADLSIIVGEDDLVIMVGEKEPYRRLITEQLHGHLSDDRFIKTIPFPRRRPVPRTPFVAAGASIE
jgi:hypothetical protein